MYYMPLSHSDWVRSLYVHLKHSATNIQLIQLDKQLALPRSFDLYMYYPIALKICVSEETGWCICKTCTDKTVI